MLVNDSTNIYDDQIYKNSECAGLDCRSEPVVRLKIRYISKEGYFCKKCSEELLHLDLADHVCGTNLNGLSFGTENGGSE